MLEVEVEKKEDVIQYDVLGRQQFVNQLISVAETLSENQKNACYAINGEWGVGKTFVLEAFEKQIADYQQDSSETNKYMVFHYNCWQYDYYDEPLIAVVAVLLDQIDKQARLIPEEKLEKIKAALKIIGASLWGKAKDLLKEKTGFDISQITKLFQSTKDDAEEQIAETHKFDTYFDFKNVLLQLSELIDSIAKGQTVIFVVDELDRCLPEYTIKILERLHHVFADIPNVQVILSVDRSQLENTVKNIYGQSTSVRKYLEKFIQFEIKLTAGEVTDIIEELYPQYHDCFKVNITSRQDVNEVCRLILNGIDIRTAKVIVEKSFLCHRLLNSDDEYQDGCILFLEVFLTLLKQYGFDRNSAKSNFRIEHLFTSSSFSNSTSRIFYGDTNPLSGLIRLGNYYGDHNNYKMYFTNDQYRQSYVRIGDIWGLILASYRAFIGFDDKWVNEATYSTLSDKKYPKQYIMDYINKFWEFLQIVS